MKKQIMLLIKVVSTLLIQVYIQGKSKTPLPKRKLMLNLDQPLTNPKLMSVAIVRKRTRVNLWCKLISKGAQNVRLERAQVRVFQRIWIQLTLQSPKITFVVEIVMDCLTLRLTWTPMPRNANCVPLERVLIKLCKGIWISYTKNYVAIVATSNSQVSRTKLRIKIPGAINWIYANCGVRFVGQVGHSKVAPMSEFRIT